MLLARARQIRTRDENGKQLDLLFCAKCEENLRMKEELRPDLKGKVRLPCATRPCKNSWFQNPFAEVWILFAMRLDSKILSALNAGEEIKKAARVDDMATLDLLVELEQELRKG